MTLTLPDEAATEAHGATLAKQILGGEVLYLSGPLGAGKTTWVRGFLGGLGHAGRVKSPTYTLVEPYRLGGRDIYHFDLYRLNDPEELEAMGIRDYCNDQAICLIEWPEQGGGVLPEADLILTLQHADSGRTLGLAAASGRGEALINQL